MNSNSYNTPPALLEAAAALADCPVLADWCGAQEDAGDVVPFDGRRAALDISALGRWNRRLTAPAWAALEAAWDALEAGRASLLR